MIKRQNGRKLTPTQVRRMRRLRTGGPRSKPMTFKAIAAKFGVDVSTAFRAITGELYSNVI